MCEQFELSADHWRPPSLIAGAQAGPNSGVIALQLALHSWTLPSLGQGKTTLRDLYPWPWSKTKSYLIWPTFWSAMLSAMLHRIFLESGCSTVVGWLHCILRCQTLHSAHYTMCREQVTALHSKILLSAHYTIHTLFIALQYCKVGGSLHYIVIVRHWIELRVV